MKPHARLIKNLGESFWIVFTPPFTGTGWCGTRHDRSLHGALRMWKLKQPAGG